MTIPQFIYRWVPVLLWMGGIWWLSNQPDLNSGLQQDFILRKIAHVLEYAILTWLLIRALKVHVSWKMAVGLALIIGVLYSISDEWHQSWVPGRHGVITDVEIDTIGILATSLIAYFRHKKTAHI